MFLFITSVWSNTLFQSPFIELYYSDSLQAKNSRNDSLLPKFDGEEALRELMLKVPDLWSIGGLAEHKLVTRLKVQIVFVDGTKEAFCEVGSNQTEKQYLPTEWTLRMGVDFISGGSNVVEDHVKLCLEQARNQFGLAVLNEAGKVEFLVSKKEETELDLYRVNGKMDDKVRIKVLSTTKIVEKTHQCPTDIQTYRMLMDVYDQVKDTEVDIYQINEELNGGKKWGKQIQSCAFSREWNQRYSEKFELQCELEDNRCEIWQSEDGTKEWELHDAKANLFRYAGPLYFQGEKKYSRWWKSYGLDFDSSFKENLPRGLFESEVRTGFFGASYH